MKIRSEKVFILEGRSLVKMIRLSCERCLFINKKTIDVEIAPLSQDNLVTAPAFYVTQPDLAGPFLVILNITREPQLKYG